MNTITKLRSLERKARRDGCENLAKGFRERIDALKISQRRGASIPASADPIGVGASGVPTERSLDRPTLNMNTNQER